jgi:hypothetical protein
VDNREKEAAAEYRRLVRVLDGLGTGWANRLPTVYVLAPADDDYFRRMFELVQPFVLAKRAHARVRILHDGDPVPADAAAVVIAGFSPTPAGRERVRTWLEAGGTVYQSVENDFAPSVRLGALEDLARPRLWLERGTSRLSAHRFLTLPSQRVRTASAGEGAEVLGLLARTPVEPPAWGFGEPLFVRATVGRGRFFYLGADVERGLVSLYDPWREDETHRLYEALLPAAELDASNPAVELAHLARGAEELVLIANHSESWQDVIVSARRPRRLVDAETGAELGRSAAIALRLAPAEVVIARSSTLE